MNDLCGSVPEKSADVNSPLQETCALVAYGVEVSGVLGRQRKSCEPTEDVSTSSGEAFNCGNSVTDQIIT